MSFDDFTIPIIMIIAGVLSYRFPPKKINIFYGYKTKRSMQNIEAWHYAHKYFGVMNCVFGVVSLMISFAVSNIINANILLGVQVLFCVIPMIFTEISLKKHFP